LPADQSDFGTATRFANALLKNGVTVLKATESFEAGGKRYPGGSYVVKTAQAFRPHILDMFEPQDHPNDFAYPGGPPKAPYDITGWTLALQMGVQFDRILGGFDGPFQKIEGVLEGAPAAVGGAANPAGFLISHKINQGFKLINRLLKAGCEVYWLRQQAGDIWVPATPVAAEIIRKGAAELGVPALGSRDRQRGEALKLEAARVGLYDQYGGLPPSGWIRWVFDEFEFPYQMIYPRTLDAGELKKNFDVLVFPDGAVRAREGGAGQPNPEQIPEQYRNWLGAITDNKTVPQIKKFVEAGGAVVAIGSSANLGEKLGLAVRSYLTEKTVSGTERPLPTEKFFIPGSLLRASVDNSDPLAYGMPAQAAVFYENHPVFRLEPDAARRHTSAVAWFAGPQSLESGWAWGQH